MSYFLSSLELRDSPSKVRVQVLRKGRWKHPAAPNGILEVDDQMLDTLEQAFRSGVRGTELPVNLNHKQDDFVVGWLRDLRREGDALVGYVDVVDRDVAQALREQKLRYSSAEVLFNYTDPETQQTYPAVLKGLAFTNYPFIKMMQPAEVLNLSEIEEVQLMEERLSEIEARLAEYQAQLEQASTQIKQLQEENARLRAVNDTLLAETRRQQDEILLKEYEDSVPPAVRKIASALLAMTRGEEVHLSEFREGESRNADLRDLVLLLLSEFQAMGKRAVPADDVRVATPRTVGDNGDKIIARAEERARQKNVPFDQALKMVLREQSI